MTCRPFPVALLAAVLACPAAALAQSKAGRPPAPGGAAAPLALPLRIDGRTVITAAGTFAGGVADAVNGCSPTAGAYDPLGSEAWVPTCSGTWLGSLPSEVPTYAVIGLNCLGEDDAGGCGTPKRVNTAVAPLSQLLVQSVAQNSATYQNALSINMDSANGSANNVGLTTWVRMHAKPDGSPAPSTWAGNPAILCDEGSGGSLCVNQELDYSNNDTDCGLDAPGCPGLHVLEWHNYLSSYPINASIYATAGTDTSTGTATVAGDVLTIRTLDKGHDFTRDTVTVVLGCAAGAEEEPCPGGTIYRVLSHTAKTATLDGRPPQQGPVRFQWATHAVSDFILVSGDNMVADSDLSLTDSADRVIHAWGHHRVVLDGSGDAAPYGFQFAAGQMGCFNDLDACLSYAGGLRYVEGGTAVLTASARASAFSGTVTAKGFTETLATPASSSAPCEKGQFGDDANYHYVCVARNTWKRVALSSF